MFGSSTSLCTHAREGCNAFWPKPLCLNFCLWVTYTIFNQDKVQAVSWCPDWSTPSPTWPHGRGSVGTPSKCPAPQRSPSSGCGTGVDLSGCSKDSRWSCGSEEMLGPTLTWQHMGYDCSVHLGCKDSKTSQASWHSLPTLQCQRLSN